MKVIQCEMCGSHDLIKKDGVFVCENCGTKYTLEEAKKLMIDGVVSVSIDTSKKEQDLLKIIKTAYDAGNYQEIYDSATKLVEMNPNLWRGWFYKGIGAGYLSEKEVERFDESLTYFQQAIDSCSEEEYEVEKDYIRDEMLKMIEWLFNTHCFNYQATRNEKDSYDMEAFLISSFVCINAIVEQFDYSYCRAYELKSDLLDNYFDTLKKIQHTSNLMFGKEKSQRTDERFDKWIDEQIDLSSCAKTLLESEIRPQNFEKYFNFFAKTIDNRLHGCSYTYIDGYGYVENVSLADESKKIAKNMLNEVLTEKEQIIADAEKRENEYRLAKNEEYWEEHKDEKEELLNKKKSLEDNLKDLDAKIDNIDNAVASAKAKYKKVLPEEERVIAIERQIELTKCDLKKHSLFDFKGKAPTKEKIKELKAQLANESSLASAARKKYDASIKREIDQLIKEKMNLLSDKEITLKKINEIKETLTKNH